MIIIERMITEIYPGKLAELQELDKRYDAIEAGLGFPPKKRLLSISGVHDFNEVILERQWESMAAMEAAVEKSLVNPGIQALNEEGTAIIKSTRIELYTPAD
ncbi:MAG: hypothetical protein JSW55_05980 [Chloroflexota bacterium]|nr:MAG: hypothetical protein JSW55_05980 [Chloroflexota bacterium]